MQDPLSYLDMMETLLVSLPTRSQLSGTSRHLQKTTANSIQLHVERSLPFEFVGNLLPPFCGLWGSELKLSYSDYDAALPELGSHNTADAYIMWLDWRIYAKSMSAAEAASWLESRLIRLREVTDRPIWFNNWPEVSGEGELLFGSRVSERSWFRQLNAALGALLPRHMGCELIDLAQLAAESDESFYDDRNQEVSQYPFSGRATIRIARHVGVQLLPAAFMPRIKAIALDLDDTLYRGVLGEDGPDGVHLTEGHSRLQKLLLRLQRSGILLTICSRNEKEDVQELFAKRADFPLKWNDIAAVAANWQPKPLNVQQLAEQLNIAPSAMLFVDDNPAELLKMAAELSEVKLLRASATAEHTLQVLTCYPGLYQQYPDQEATKRTADIQANQIREQVKNKAASLNDYLSSLGMVITIHENQQEHAGRLYDLSRKTNQFNLALRRMTESEAEEVMASDHYLTLTISLKDILSDSGLIGAYVCRIDGEEAYLEETLFSCRALGRGIETVSFDYLLRRLAAQGVLRISIVRREGPRNAPAIGWMDSLLMNDAAPYDVETLLDRVQETCASHPAKLEVSE